MAHTSDETTAGARLRVLRKWRRLSLQELGGLADLSPSFLSRAERGLRMLDRRSHIAALASALRVSEVDLVGGPHLSADRAQSDPHAVIPTLRTALTTNSLNDGIVDTARPLAELLSAIGRLDPLRRQCDYVALGGVLPDLLDELHVHIAAPAGEQDKRVALTALVEVCVAATFTSKNLGYLDLAHIAANRASEAAHLLDDPVQRGKSDYLLLHTVSRASGSWDRHFRLAAKAAERLQPHAHTPEELCPLGMVTLTTALAAASARDEGQARDWLDEADQIACHVSNEPQRNWQSFSAENVKAWRVAIGVELHDPVESVRATALAIDQDKLGEHRRAALLADVGRGMAREPRTSRGAIQWLHEAERIAPQRIRNDTRVQEAVAVLMNRAHRAAGGRQLRGMASRMGVPH